MKAKTKIRFINNSMHYPYTDFIYQLVINMREIRLKEMDDAIKLFSRTLRLWNL